MSSVYILSVVVSGVIINAIDCIVICEFALCVWGGGGQLMCKAWFPVNSKCFKNLTRSYRKISRSYVRLFCLDVSAEISLSHILDPALVSQASWAGSGL